MLLLEAGVVGVFVATDVFLFYVFFELTLVPMYFIVGVWGGERRIYAAIKFFLYTAFGSLLMLVGILYLFFRAKTLLGVPTFAYEDFLLDPAHAEGAALALRGVRARVQREGARLPAAHVAPRRARRGADAGLRDPGRGASEDGDLRLRAVPAAALPGGRAAPDGRDDDARAGRDRDPVHGVGRGRAARRQEAGRLHVGRPHGLRRARGLRAHGQRAAGRPGRHDLARNQHRGALPPARHAVRAPTHPGDRRLRRPRHASPRGSRPRSSSRRWPRSGCRARAGSSASSSRSWARSRATARSRSSRRSA